MLILLVNLEIFDYSKNIQTSFALHTPVAVFYCGLVLYNLQEINSLKQQLTDVKMKNDEKLVLQTEELRKKLMKEAEVFKKELEQSEYARVRSEKAKEKLMHEVSWSSSFMAALINF